MPSHNHSGVTSSAGSHNHTGNTNAGGDHNHTGNTGNAGSHNHTYQDAYFAENSGGGTNIFGTNAATDNDNDFRWRTSSGGSSNTPSDINTSTIGDHNHSIANSGTHTHGIDTDGTHTHNISSQGGGQAHNNLPPYTVINYIIKF